MLLNLVTLIHADPPLGRKSGTAVLRAIQASVLHGLIAKRRTPQPEGQFKFSEGHNLKGL